ncbi:MAG: hypothetical protein ACOY3P_26950 [Planctomycetota bacterium]
MFRSRVREGLNDSGDKVEQDTFTYDLQGRLQTATITSCTAGQPDRVERSTYEYDAAGIRVAAVVETDEGADGTFDTSTRTEYLNDPRNDTP